MRDGDIQEEDFTGSSENQYLARIKSNLDTLFTGPNDLCPVVDGPGFMLFGSLKPRGHVVPCKIRLYTSDALANVAGSKNASYFLEILRPSSLIRS